MSTEKPGPTEAGKGELLLDQVRRVMRLHRYSIHSERTYMDWIRRFVLFHKMKSRDDLQGGEAKIEAFLTDLAINRNVAPATQNQAMNALVFLYKKVLEQPLNEKINAVRSDKKVNLPVVLTREEVAKVIPLLDGSNQLIVRLLYVSGLRIMEAVRLRVKDVDFAMKQITVRSGKGDKDRFTTFAGSMIPLLQAHLAKVGARGVTSLQVAFSIHPTHRTADVAAIAGLGGQTLYGQHNRRVVNPAGRLAQFLQCHPAVLTTGP